MILKLVISLLATSLVLGPSMSYAQDEVEVEIPPVQGKVVPLDEGERSPFDGVLFDEAAVAKVLSEKLALELEKEEAIRLLEEEFRVEKQYLERLYRADLEFERQRAEALLESRDEEIDELYAILEESDDDFIWWLLGGIAGGMVVAGATAALIVYVN